MGFILLHTHWIQGSLSDVYLLDTGFILSHILTGYRVHSLTYTHWIQGPYMIYHMCTHWIWASFSRTLTGYGLHSLAYSLDTGFILSHTHRIQASFSHILTRYRFYSLSHSLDTGVRHPYVCVIIIQRFELNWIGTWQENTTFSFIILNLTAL